MSETDTIFIKAKIDRIEQHQNLLKSDNKEILSRQLLQGEALKRIEHALKGSEMNGNVGIVEDLKAANEDIDNIKDTCLKHKIYFGFIGVVLIASGVFSKIFKFLF